MSNRVQSTESISSLGIPSRLLTWRRWAAAFVVLMISGALLPLSEAPALESAGFQIIAHPSAPVSSLTEAEASDYFLKKATTWPDGSRVTPVTLADREVTDTFARKVHRRNALAIRKFWQRQVFTGRGVPPQEMKTVEHVLSFVSSRPGAIGYVPASTALRDRGVHAIELRGN